MIHIIETNELPEKPAPEILSAIEQADAAARLANQFRDEAVSIIKNLDVEARLVQVMCLYWNATHIFRPGELAGFLGMSLGVFTKLTKEWQPCRVEKCTGCKRPAIIRKNRDGSETDPLCDQCAHQQRAAEYQREVAERQTLRLQSIENSAVGNIDRALIVYLLNNPTGGTYAKLCAMVEAENKPREFEKAFNNLVHRGRLVPVSETPGGTKIYTLKKIDPATFLKKETA